MSRHKGSKNKKQSVERPDDQYSISLIVGQDVYEGKGKTPLEAIIALQLPMKVVSKGRLIFSRGEHRKEILVMPFGIKRLSMKIIRPMLLRQFDFGLK